MQELPVGVQDFPMIRKDNLLYVDKTDELLALIKQGRRYFLARPRRFGKSLTLSTLEAMFRGRSELFAGLAAESWVKARRAEPYSVLKLDLSALAAYQSAAELNTSLVDYLQKQARFHGVTVAKQAQACAVLSDLLTALSAKYGELVLLVDEYDKPILDNVQNVQQAEAMRSQLRSFYSILKSHDAHLRFLFLTGISKFTKVGVFSALNNLVDISLMHKFSQIVGYTQSELENNFSEYIKTTANHLKLTASEVINLLKEYYDGFSFDGKTKIYNPFSILNYFISEETKNFWYDSGSPTFIVNWLKDHKIDSPEKYRGRRVPFDFTDSHEIEMAEPENFLFQSGYLTIKNIENGQYILDYPNKEVLISLSRMYLQQLYHVEHYATLGTALWQALASKDFAALINEFNQALAQIPYEDFSSRDEFWYRSLLLMLLRGAGLQGEAEVHTSLGRSDIVIQFDRLVIVLEFKFAKDSANVAQKSRQGREQLASKRYAERYRGGNRQISQAVVVACDEIRKAIFCPVDTETSNSFGR
ncbi:MAG: ATP-binding protein [Desulfovibrio sp.]|nr:ATP-binding protein [Desulfovibrio sp.]